MADDRPFITGSSSRRQEKTRRRARAKIYLKDPLVTNDLPPSDRFEVC